MAPVRGSKGSSRVSGCHPVTVLSGFDGIFRDIVCSIVCSNIRGLLSFGRRNFMGYESALAGLYSFARCLSSALSSGDRMSIICASFSGTFSHVSRTVLVRGLRSCSLSPSLVSLLSSCLGGQFLFIRLRNTGSGLFRTSSNIPRNSGLKPLLFLLFVGSVALTISRGGLLFTSSLGVFGSISALSSYVSLRASVGGLRS